MRAIISRKHFVQHMVARWKLHLVELISPIWDWRFLNFVLSKLVLISSRYEWSRAGKKAHHGSTSEDPVVLRCTFIFTHAYGKPQSVAGDNLFHFFVCDHINETYLLISSFGWDMTVNLSVNYQFAYSQMQSVHLDAFPRKYRHLEFFSLMLLFLFKCWFYYYFLLFDASENDRKVSLKDWFTEVILLTLLCYNFISVYYSCFFWIQPFLKGLN